MKDFESYGLLIDFMEPQFSCYFLDDSISYDVLFVCLLPVISNFNLHSLLGNAFLLFIHFELFFV